MESPLHLLPNILARFFLQAHGEPLALIQYKGIVQQIHACNGVVETIAARHRGGGVGAIEFAEGAVLLQARFELIDHATEFGRTEFRFWREHHDVTRIIPKMVAGAAHAAIENAADLQHRIAQRFSFESVRPHVPEQAVARIHGNGLCVRFAGLTVSVR